MTTALVVLVGVVIGGGYIFWRVSQTQYYVTANSSGQVVIYRGINYHILGFSWSSPYQRTGIQLAQVPSELPADGDHRGQHGQPVPGAARR